MTTRRYEVLLPARFNNGHEVVETCMRCLPDTLMEVVDRFGAAGAAARHRRVFTDGRASLRHVEVIARVLDALRARLSPEQWAGAEPALANKARDYTPRSRRPGALR